MNDKLAKVLLMRPLPLQVQCEDQKTLHNGYNHFKSVDDLREVINDYMNRMYESIGQLLYL